jgi:PAS domain S-box-containing protein
MMPDQKKSKQQLIAELQVSRQRIEEFEKTFETIPDMVSIHDRDMNIVYSNWKGFGAVAEERRKTNTKCYRTYRGFDSVCPDCQAKTVLETKEPFQAEVELPDGDWFEIRVLPILNQQGDCALFVEWVRNITVRKKSQEALQVYSQDLEGMVAERTRELEQARKAVSEALNLNRKILATSSLGITAYDSKGDCVIANQAVARIIGASVEQVLSQNFREIASWEQVGMLELAESALATGESKRKTFRLVTIFGQEISIECRFSTFIQGGEQHLLLVIDDITKRVQMQEQLLRHEKLAALGELAAGMSHELRNPLGSIRNAAYLLRMIIEPDDPQVEEALAIMEHEIDRSAAIITALLDYARSKPPELEPVAINDILERSLANIFIPERISLVIQFEKDLPALMADPTQLSQVFENLILNAVQAMPEGGTLTVRSETCPDGRSLVTIADTGIGIPAGDQEKIFDPLFTTKARGIGLGLSIVRTLVNGHGGTIECESDGVPGEGTRFKVYLPHDRGAFSAQRRERR